MCLAIPGKVVEITTHEGMRTARVQFGGVTREACQGCEWAGLCTTVAAGGYRDVRL